MLNVTILLLLMAMVGYALILLANNSRTQSLQQQTMALETEVLKTRIQQIKDRAAADVNDTKSAWSGFRKFRIVKKVQETKSICSFYLSPHNGRPLPGFLPGQYLTFQLDIPGQTKPVIRCYSLSDSPYHPGRYRVTIKQVGPPADNPKAPPGLGSSFFHDTLNERDIVDVKAPGGHFHLNMNQTTPVVLLAGGVGITPLLSMLNAITEMGMKRETWFFLGVQNKEEHPMKEHLETAAKENENVHLHVCYSKPGPSDVKDQDYRHGERVTIDLLKRVLPSNNYDFFICAPPPMVKALRGDLAEWGVPKKNIHFEAFGSETVKKCKVEEKVKEAAPMEVTFAKSGKTFPWDSKMNSLLDFAEAKGITIDSGCGGGGCGTCQTAVKKGGVNYLKEPGFDPEGGSCLPCISVPKENLTLDA